MQYLNFKIFYALVVIGLILSGSLAYSKDESGNVIVFAAASTVNALDEISAEYHKTTNKKIVVSYGASSTMAKQIEQGAPADIFLSANADWMDYLIDKGMIIPNNKIDLLVNEIVLIAPIDSTIKEVSVTYDLEFELDSLLDGGKLAMGDPQHVPAGMYASTSFAYLGIWSIIEPKIVPTKDVRAALRLVELKECPLGVVYASDAVSSTKVKIVGEFPSQSYPEAIYPLALVGKDVDNDAADFFKFMASDSAQLIWKKHGFEIFWKLN